MNKFLNREVKAGEQSPANSPQGNMRSQEAIDVLREAQASWSSLEEARKKMRRSIMYAYEDQWGDLVPDMENPGRYIRESDMIKRNGKAPLKNNMIRPIIKNVDGQFRQTPMKPVCVVRDQAEAKLGEMMSIAIEYVHQINEMVEVDADCLNNIMMGGFCAQRIEYGFNPARQLQDVWCYPINPNRFFFNTSIEDIRGWDMNLIGEIFDLPLQDVIANFAKKPSEQELVRRIYGEKERTNFYGNAGMQGDEQKNMAFFTPSRPDLCRVILVWRKESNECLFCHDELTGEWWHAELDREQEIIAENQLRLQQGLESGMMEEDILLVKYEWTIERYWKYYYLSPDGKVLQQGRSPYWHKEHNYVWLAYPLVQGKIFNFVEDFIDQQRAINRTLTLIDFIRGTSSKGVLVVNEDSLPDMTKEEIVDEYVRYNGVLFAKLKNGQNIDNVVRQYTGNATVAGDFELLNLQLKLINDISGVSGAMQGRPPQQAQTPASLYAQQVQNSSVNLAGLFGAYGNFRRKRDIKLMQTIQQFYTSGRHLDLSGKNYSAESKYYDPQKVQNCEIDLALADSPDTPVYQGMVNDFLMQLFGAQAIGVEQLLENCTLPFASRILESIKVQQQQLAQQQAMQPVDPNLMQQAQAQADPQAMAMINQALQ